MTFTKQDLRENQKIIIYGASVYGELALRGLECLGLKPYCFIDRARCGGDYLGYSVLSPNEVVKYKEDCILIASADFYYEIFNFLEGNDCEYIYDISHLLMQNIEMDILSNRAKEMYDAKENYFLATAATELTIVHLGFCVSERCSLRCRDCSFLMQYYQNPQNIDLEYYKPALDRFIDAIDIISEFRIYGGEPFMNPDMYKLIEWYGECEKIKNLSIYTNGTIVPPAKTIECLKHPKVRVHISDYGHNMDKVKYLVEVLEKEKIPYFIRRYDIWQQAGNLRKRQYDEGKMQEIFERCFATNCYSFLKGKFYACPRAAHAENLGAMPETVADRVDFTDETLSIEELREQLIDLMHHRKWIEACRYCDGLDNHVAGGVQPAVQISKPLDYMRIEK